jgi:hypothetical protein
MQKLIHRLIVKNIMKLLFYPRGLSFVAYYFLVGGVLGKTFSEKFYNSIHRIK